MTFVRNFCIDCKPVARILKKIEGGLCNGRNDKFEVLAYIRFFT